MKIEISVPDNVVEKIELMQALEMVDTIPLKDYLVCCVIDDTRCRLEFHNLVLPKEWPDAEAPA